MYDSWGDNECSHSWRDPVNNSDFKWRNVPDDVWVDYCKLCDVYWNRAYETKYDVPGHLPGATIWSVKCLLDLINEVANENKYAVNEALISNLMDCVSDLLNEV